MVNNPSANAAQEMEAHGDLRDLLLKRLWSQRAPLTAHFQADGQPLITSILRLIPHTGHLYLDEFNHEAGQALLLQAGKIMLRGQLQGVALRMELELEAKEELDGVALYRMRLPECLYYQQQRDAFRARVPHDWAIAATLAFSDRHHLGGRITDISFTGFRASFHSPHHLTLDDTPYSAELYIPHQEPILVSVEIRHIDYSDDGHIHIGARFLDLEPADERTLSGLIRRIERRWLQQRSLYFDEDTPGW